MSGFLDAALAIHPRAWRERYADEVRGTLLDVADATGGRVPLAETLPLGFRGLWLRARGSVTFWVGLVIIASTIAGTGVQYSGFRTDPAWTSVGMHLNQGLALALVLAAIASGWAGARARLDHVVGATSRLARLWRDSWPVLLFIGVGYLASLVLVLLASGWPWLLPPSVLVSAAQLVVTLAAVGVAYAAGYVLPRVIVIFVAPAVVTVILLLLFAWQTPWMVASGGGYGIFLGLRTEPAAGPFVHLIAISAVLLAVSVILVGLRWLVARVGLVIVIFVVAIAVAVSDAPLTTDPAIVARPQSDLVCVGENPEICLWPEQDVAYGESVREQMSAAYDRARAIGLPVGDTAPSVAARYGLTGSNAGAVTGLRPESLVNYYASTFVDGYVEEPTVGDGGYLALMYSIAILLGVPREEAWPAAPDPYTGNIMFDASEVPDEAAARALVERWLSEGVNGVRQP